jgi:pimeloyl-ACP methyl ester carboxylesterase
MVPGIVRVDGRRVRFAVSDNEGVAGPDGAGSPPVWAINIHGYLAGGGIYWRESSRLAEALGWRVVNPSLPGFGGSDPLKWEQVSLSRLADQVAAVAAHVGAGPAVLLGHSMGGAVAIRRAVADPAQTLGVIYRDGVGTPAWKKRRGLIPALLAPIAPDVAAPADLLVSLAIDMPDLFMGRMYSTFRSFLPDARRNIRTMGRTVPVGSMLMAVDQRDELAGLAERGEIPILPVWGVFDRLANVATADEFAALSRSEVQWVPGGHSWMLARPQGQGDVLRHLPLGLEFLRKVEDRWRRVHAHDTGVQAPIRIVS